jgi:hypothetical protein
MPKVMMGVIFRGGEVRREYVRKKLARCTRDAQQGWTEVARDRRDEKLLRGVATCETSVFAPGAKKR